MSRISIPKSYAVLVGMESYMRTKRKLKGIENSLEHKKDQILHPEKVKQHDEDQKDKSESAEKERQHVEKLKLEDKKGQDRGNESLKSRFARKLDFRGKEDESKETTSNGGIGIPGTSTDPKGGLPVI